MLHIIKYRAKCMLRNHSLMFWTLAFPLILTTLFGAVLRNAYDAPTFDTIPIAMINEEAYQENTLIQEAIKAATYRDRPMFQVKETTSEQAKQLLKDEKVDAIIQDKGNYAISIKNNGLSQTIVQSFFDECKQKEVMLTNLMEQGASMNEIQDLMRDTQSYLKTQDDTNTNLSGVFFYTLLAMNAMFGGYWSINSMYTVQANQSDIAARNCVAPTHKAMNLFCNLLLNLVFQGIFLLIVFLYMYLVLNIVFFGSSLGYVALALLVGILAANGLGLLIGSLFHKNEGSANGILTAVTMLGSFLAGMMMVNMKYTIQVNAPILAYINPVNMITDALYSLYYYGVGERYWMNLGLLLVFAIICFVLSYRTLSRKRYQSLGVR